MVPAVHTECQVNRVLSWSGHVHYPARVMSVVKAFAVVASPLVFL